MNIERAAKRRKPQDLKLVDAPFDEREFNFNKVPSKEILLNLRDVASADDEQHQLLINVSPLEFGNSLLVPSIKKSIPQRVTLSGLTLLIRMMLLSDDV